MSPCSSSGSWSGGVGPADIIDLDRYMRGAVRPSRPHGDSAPLCEQLVVDAGGASRKPVVACPVAAPSSSSGSDHRDRDHDRDRDRDRDKRDKRFSHDSGLSDESYVRRRHRPHRGASGPDSAVSGRARKPASARTLNVSTNSLSAFKAVCERALLDQQQQIARVAELCERLGEQRAERHEEPRVERRVEPPTADTSDLSSSSRSTRDQRRKDKNRTAECKTYKIIMNKLDELNRLFATRARPSPAPAPPSTCSVTVSDKVVSTEPDVQRTTNKIINMQRGFVAPGPLSRPRAVTQAYAFDIAPADALPHAKRPNDCPNVVTESVVKCASSCCGSRWSGHAGDPRSGFDLDDPVHLYAQAKRLQTLHAQHASTRRTRSGDSSVRESALDAKLDARMGGRCDARSGARCSVRSEGGRDTSLCALCRVYWRSLRHCLAAQIFARPDAACPCS